jgi:hypothetical protein
MPLLDHFHPPLSSARHWGSFHARWASAISDSLNAVLPRGYFAEIQVHVGSRVEVDVGTFEEVSRSETRSRSEGGVALAEAPAWVAQPPAFSLPLVFPDQIEALVYNDENVLVGAVELISPANKDREETRTAFAAKCATYLHEGVGVVIADIVTNRGGDLHGELMALLGGDRTDLDLYAAAYRPLRRPDGGRLDAWLETLKVGGSLPSLPLALGPRLTVRLDLDATYHEACQHLRLP